MPDRMMRSSSFRWVPVKDMVICGAAQREANPRWMQTIADNFDPDQFGIPVLSLRDGRYYVIDGQHRIGALRLLGYHEQQQQVQCEVYEGLDEAEEAALFLRRNDNLDVAAMDEFLVALTAGLEEATDINRTVLAQGLRIGRHSDCIRAVQSVRAVYRAGGATLLGRALRIIRDSFGVEACDAQTIRGMGKLCQRYNGELPDAAIVDALGKLPRGRHGLQQKANELRERFGWAKDVSTAAAVVDIVNKSLPPKARITPWVKATAAVE